MNSQQRSFAGNAHQAMLCLMTATMLIGIVYAALLPNSVRYPDERDYQKLSLSLVETGSFSFNGCTPTAYRPPGYPMLLALMGGCLSVTSGRILNLLSLCGTQWLLYLCMRREGKPAIGVVAAAMIICYPVMLYTACTLHAQTVAMAMFVGVVVLLARGGSLRVSVALGAGALSGFLLLTVPAFVCVLATLVIWRLFTYGDRDVKPLLACGLGLLLALLPWTIRNRVVLGEWVFVSTNSGINLLLGNCENTTPNGGATIDVSHYVARTENMSETERDRYYRRCAWMHVKNRPGRSVAMYGLKLMNHFNIRNKLYVSKESAPWKDLVMGVTYGTLLLLVLSRLMISARYPLGALERLCLLLYLVNALFAALFFTRIRLRLPFDVFLMIPAAVFVSWAASRTRYADRKTVGIGV